MNATEKAVLKTAIENLEKSTRTDWRTGYFDDWTEYAKKMKQTILNNVNILRSMMEVPDEPKNPVDEA